MRLSAASLAVALAAVMVVDRADLGGDRATESEETAALDRGLSGGQMMEVTGDEADSSPGRLQGALSDGSPAPETTHGNQQQARAAGEPQATPTGGNADADAGGATNDVPMDEVYAASPPEEQLEAPAQAHSDDGDGDIGVIGIAEIILAVALGAALGGVVALAASGRRVRQGTNR
jgi:hypothetical protein